MVCRGPGVGGGAGLLGLLLGLLLGGLLGGERGGEEQGGESDDDAEHYWRGPRRKGLVGLSVSRSWRASYGELKKARRRC